MKAYLLKTGLFASAFALVAGSALAADKVVFVVDWYPAGHTGFTHVGVQEGFFAEEDLDVSIEIARGSADAVTRIASGAADVGNASMGALMAAAAENGGTIPAKAVMAIYTKAPDSIVTYDGSGIDKIADLKGRKLGTATFNGSNTIWPGIAALNGIDADDVPLTKVDFNAVGSILATGQVDAVIGWRTSALAYVPMLEETGKTMKVLPWSDYGYEGYNWSLVASDNFIEERPEVLKRFVRAYKKTVEFVLANPEKAAADVHGMVSTTDEATNLKQIQEMTPMVRNEISEKDGLGTLTPELVATTWQWVATSQDYADDRIDPDSVVDRSFLPSAE
ncbi:ABC transporter substrate-binding protein [Acuticoccus mangrovi]|uniref:ABC transporter substrate-binding protein n=1 Tax=Acuticoccus mangrovi TaxID=2796142 RepID=A0A934MHX1_9HYPH|nr:ABC transporter substrate-binding protein [Acuticoccus mangrovi]MBJ3778138.1 ABC transporter substrate-binding protein [Acuticoccus mangrovi]